MLGFKITIFFVLTILLLSIESKIIHVAYQLTEEPPQGTYVGNIVNDANLSSLIDSDDLRKITFKFLGDDPDFFNLNPITGLLETSSKRLDRESFCPKKHECRINFDVGIKPLQFFHIIKISVLVLDINDHNPVFSPSLQVIEVSESAPVGSFYRLLLANDEDSPSNSVVDYSLGEFSPGSYDIFVLDWKRPSNSSHIQAPTPRLMLNRPLDRESQNLYQAELTARDGGTPSKTGKLIVEIRVTDANDNAPIFNQQSYEVKVSENLPINSAIITVHATDKDEGLNGMVSYYFSPVSLSAYGNTFKINNKTGQITTISSLDYEIKQSYQLVVEARDSGAEPMIVSTVVNVLVEDVNDNAPIISSNSITSHQEYDAVLPEDSTINTFVSHVTVADHDSGLGGTVTCFLQNLSDEGVSNIKQSPFKLNKLNDVEHQIETAMLLDREKKDLYTLQIFCHDNGKPRLNSTKILKIKIEDINDCSPVFTNKRHSVDVYENNYAGVAVLKIDAEDCDVGENGRLTYILLNQEESFALDPKSGLLTAKVSFDREIVGDSMEVSVMVKDNGTPTKSSSAEFIVNILDINDNPPIFQRSAFQFNVTENLPKRTFVGSLKATDKDKSSTENSRIFYSILPGPSADNFIISNLTGDLYTSEELDRETEEVHYLTVIAKDNGVPSLSSSSRVVVVVKDTNDNYPLFEVPNFYNATIQLSSKAPRNYTVARFSAYDFDSGENGKVIYGMYNHSLHGELLHLNPKNGVLTLLSDDISRLEGTIIKLKIWVKDSAKPPEVSLKTETQVFIAINRSAPLLVKGKYINSDDWLLALGYYDSYTNNKTGYIYFVLLSFFIMLALSIIFVLIIVFCIKRIKSFSKASSSCLRVSDFDNYNCRQEALKKMSRIPLSSTVNTELMMAVDDDDDNCHLVNDEIIDGNCSFIAGFKNLSHNSETLGLNGKARTLDVSFTSLLIYFENCYKTCQTKHFHYHIFNLREASCSVNQFLI